MNVQKLQILASFLYGNLKENHVVYNIIYDETNIIIWARWGIISGCGSGDPRPKVADFSIIIEPNVQGGSDF